MSTVATLLVKVAGNTTELDQAFAKVDRAGKGIEQTYTALTARLKGLGGQWAQSFGSAFDTIQSTAGRAFSALDAGLGRVGAALKPITQLLPGLPGPLAAIGQAFGNLVPVPGLLGAVAGGLAVIAAAGVGVIAGLYAIGQSAANAGDALLVLSQKSGISVEALSRFQYVEKVTDASFSAITAGINRLGVNLATGSEKAAGAIKAIGLSIEEVRKLRPEEGFTRIVEGLGKIPDAGRRAALGVAIFGKGFNDFSQLTQENLRAVLAEADAFGATISTKLAVAGDRFNDTIAQMGTMLDGLKRQIGAAVLPVLIAFAETVRDQLQAAFRQAGAGGVGLTEAVGRVAVAIGQLVAEIISSLASGMKTLVTFFSARFISDAPLLRMIERTIRLIKILDSIKPGERMWSDLKRANEEIKHLSDDLGVDRWIASVKDASSTLEEIAADFEQGADRFGAQLPDRVREIQRRIDELAQGLVTGAGEFRTFGESAETAGDKAASGAAKAYDEWARLLSKFSGADAIAEAQRLVAAFETLEAQGLTPTAEAAAQTMAAMDRMADGLRRNGKELSTDLQRTYVKLIPPPTIDRDLRSFSSLFTQSMRAPVPSVRALAGEVNTGLAAIKWERFPEEGAKAFAALRWSAIVGQWSASLVQGVTQTFAQMLTGVQSFADGFRSIWRGIQGFASQIVGTVLGDLTASFTDALKKIDWGKVFSGGGIGAKQGALAGAAVGATVGAAFAQGFSKEVGIAMGALTGFATGMLAGGPVAGLVGAGVGAASAWFAGAEQEKQQRQQMNRLRADLELAHGGLDKLKGAAERLGVSWADLWETRDVEHFQRALEHLDRALRAEQKYVNDLDQSLKQLGGSGALLSRELMKAIELRPPGAEGVLGEFMQSQAAAGIKGLETFLANAQIKTEAGVAAIGGSLAGLYDELIRQGATPTQAFAQIEPAILKFQQQLDTAGIKASGAFAPLVELARLSSDAIAGPVFDAMAGLEQGLTSVHNLGLLNQETFSGFSAELLAGFKTLESQGKGGVTAMAGMRGALQKVWELSKDFGYTLSEGEQELVDFAEKSGLIGDKFRPAADRMVIAIEQLVERFDKFLTKIATTDQAAKEGARGFEGAINGIKVNPIKIPYTFEAENELPGSARLTVPALAAGAIVRRPTIALVGEKGPEAVVPLHRDFATETDLTIMLDSEVLTRAVLRKQPRVMRAYGVAR